MFANQGLLEMTLRKVTDSDIEDFLLARKENFDHFDRFVSIYADVHSDTLRE